MRTRIKICGITRPEDAELVADSGADALGMIFYEKSPRNVSIEQAKSIIKALRPLLTTVAVVVNPEESFLTHLHTDLGIDRIQFHGNETQSQCEKSLRPYYKVLRVKHKSDLLDDIKQYDKASSFLLDTYVKGQPGGTGELFNWSILDTVQINKPVILAGGLNPENVYDAIMAVKPYAVDVNSGVEIKPGIKDAIKINEFIIAVHEADQALCKHMEKHTTKQGFNA